MGYRRSIMERKVHILRLAVPIIMASMSPLFAFAQGKTMEFQAQSIEVLNNSATMLYHADYWVTSVSGSVGKEGIPKIIRLGDVVVVKGSTLRVNHIFATKCLTKMRWKDEILCEEGQVHCVAVERPEDVPSYDDRDRLWIFVSECHPLE